MKTIFKLLLLSFLLLCINIKSYGFFVTPECELQIDPDRYVVEFQISNYTIETDTHDGIGDFSAEECGPYDMIVVDGTWDATDIPGYPQLPFLALHLILPDDANTINVTFTPTGTEFAHPDYPIIPAKSGSYYDSISGTYVSMDSECENSEYYMWGMTGEYPYGFFNEFYTISDIYTVHESKGVTLSIFPFSYNPSQNQIEVLLSGTFEIEFNGSSVQHKIQSQRNDNTVFTMATKLFFDSFRDDTLVVYTPDRGNYLIIAAHNYMDDILQEYIDYKACQGYTVEVAYLDEWGYLGHPERIKQIIYSTSLGIPDFVLLIGATEDIPPYSDSSDEDDPYSDDGYHDYLGRWVLPSYEYNARDALSIIINKTIETERQYANTDRKVALFSGKDSSCSRSRWFYKDMKRIVDKVLEPLHLTYTLCDGRSSSSNYSKMKNIMESGNQHMFIYSGHGNAYGIGAPYEETGKDFFNIHTSAPYPMGFGFACKLGSYYTDENSFAARWVRDEYGGVSFYGASATTKDCPDRYLSRQVFDTYKKIRDNYANYPISIWLKNAERSYYASFRTHTRKNQTKKYNLFGDPTLYMCGLNTYCSRSIQHEQEKRGDTVTKPIIQTQITDIMGHTILTTQGNVDAHSLRNMFRNMGTLIIKRQMIDGTINIEKVIL